MVEPAVIETARLILDEHRADDFEPLAAMWADPDVVKHLSGHPSSRQDSWMRLLRYRGLWPLLGYGYWAVREKSTGRFAGDLGFADFHRQIEPSIIGIPEAGWVFATWAHGRGFATEALTAALNWLDNETDIESAVCLIAPANQGSLRVAAKGGFVQPQTVRFMDEDTLLITRRRCRSGAKPATLRR